MSAGNRATGGRYKSRIAVDPGENGVACVVLGLPLSAVDEATGFRGARGRGSGTVRIECTGRGGAIVRMPGPYDKFCKKVNRIKTYDIFGSYKYTVNSMT